MRIVLILFATSLLIALADAQRKSNFTKPVVNLDKRPRPPVWHRPPEERRKLSIFPKNNMKFVVTPKTIVKNDEEPKEGLPTKRPLMRKFVMQDRNDKELWSFAPREPLMKFRRFTVTLAPPKFNSKKDIEEMKSDESKTVKTVVNNLKTEQKSNKINALNKGNLIQMAQMKTVTPLTTQIQGKVDPKLKGDKVLELFQHLDTLQTNNSKTVQIDKVVEDLVNDEWITSSDDVILNENGIIDYNKNYLDFIKSNATAANPQEKKDSKDLSESRSDDLNDMEIQMRQNQSNSVIINNKEDLEEIKNFIELRVLLEDIDTDVNTRKEIISTPPSNLKVDDSANAHINKNLDILEDIPDIAVKELNYLLKIMPSSDDEGSENNKQENSRTTLVQDSQTISNHETLTTSKPNVDDDLTKNTVDSLILSDIERLITIIEQEASGLNNDEVNAGEPNVKDQREISRENDDELELDIVDSYTERFTAKARSRKESVNNNNLPNNDTRDNTTKPSIEIYSNDFFNSKEVSLEEQASSTHVNSDENIMELDVNKDGISNESTIAQSNLTAEDISNELLIDNSDNSSSSTGEEISNEYVSDVSNSVTEELSKELYKRTGRGDDKPNNLTFEEFSNESSSNMAGEELSNESYIDKSSNLTEEGSNYLSDELSNQSLLDVSNFEERSNESSSNMAVEELSNESYVDKSNNLTEERTNESTGSVTDEKIFDEPIYIFGSKQSDSFIASSEDANTGEISEEALRNRFRRSNNIIEEENLATTISGFKYTGQETRLNHNLSYKNINA